MYQNIARFYDAIHAQLTEDIPFILELAEDAGNPILELGCGTGRVLRPLAANGFEVVGVDNSAEMLALVNSPHTENSVNVLQQDILTLDLPKKDFSLAIFSHNTAHHFDESQLNTVLDNVRDHLREGGWVLLDMANPWMMERIENEPNFELENEFVDPETKKIVRQYSRFHNDLTAQILHVEWQYVVKGGEIINAETHYHYIEEEALQAILVKNGFAEMMLFGDYASSPFEEESPRMLVIAR